MTSKKTASRPVAAAPRTPAIAVVEQRPAVKATQRHGFKTNEYIVYPAHGVGQILSIEEQEVAGVNDFRENACQTRRFCPHVLLQGIDFRGKCDILTTQ